MTESAVLTLLSTQVQAVSGFSSSNVAVMKWGLLNSGKSDHYAILKPGAMERPRISFRTRDNAPQAIVEVWQRYKDDGTSATSLLGYADAIAARIDQYRKLADTTNTLRNAEAIGMSEVTEQWRDNADGPSWLKRDIYVAYQQETTPSYAE